MRCHSDIYLSDKFMGLTSKMLQVEEFGLSLGHLQGKKKSGFVCHS